MPQIHVAPNVKLAHWSSAVESMELSTAAISIRAASTERAAALSVVCQCRGPIHIAFALTQNAADGSQYVLNVVEA